MNKGVKFILIILALVVIGVVSAYFVLGRASTAAAHLIVESGSVSVDTGNGYVAASQEMDLSEHDKVKTADGQATLILYDSVLITLNPNTEVIIEDLTKQYPKVKQTEGSTWTKFADVVGVKNVDIETPDTVATVRGTEFGVDVTAEESIISVIEGVVDVTSDGEVTSVSEFKQLVKKKGVKAALQELSPELRRKAVQHSEESLSKMKRQRNKEVFKQKLLIEQAKKRADFTEDNIKQWLEQIDAGQIDDNKIIEKAPVKPPVLYKVKRMNDKIKKQQELIKILNNKQ